MIDIQRQAYQSDLKEQEWQWLEPCIPDASDMTVAVFRQGGTRTDVALLLTPYLSGQRCLKRLAAAEALSTMAETQYGVEAALTDYAKHHHWRTQYANWYGLTHTVKEAKRGRVAGWQSRWQMYAQIVSTAVRRPAYQS
jgi:hypothetical protein